MSAERVAAASVACGMRQQRGFVTLGTTTPGGKAMFWMLGVFAELERSIIQGRVGGGLLVAKCCSALLRPNTVAGYR
jgi:hypothetical protein